jgi:hypothetical protein
MAAMFGNTWVSQYGAAPDGLGGDTWSAALAGISGIQVARGLRQTLATGAEFPPSAPRFRAMCLGIPSLASVRYTMRKGEYDRFTALVHEKLDGYIFSRVDQRTADRMLKEAYELASEFVMRGGSLPEPPAGLLNGQKAEKPVRAPVEVARPYVESLAKLLGDPAP